MMKKVINLATVTVFFAVLMMFSACDKNGNPIVPGDDDLESHPLLWQYETSIKDMGLSDIIPAVDESDNIYFGGQENGGMSGEPYHIVSLNKNGEERWNKTYGNSASTQVIYADGKVFFASLDPVAVYAVNADNGELLWSHDLTADYDFERIPLLAYANHTLYLSSGQTIEGYLMAYNPTNGNELWLRRLYFNGGGIAMSIKGTHIYLGIGNDITCYNDLGTSCDSLWSHGTVGRNAQGLVLSEIAVAADGKIYLREENIEILDPENGETLFTVELDENFDNKTSTLTVDPNGNCYIGGGDLYKYNRFGELVWKSDISSGLISPNFIKAPTIASNGNLYNGELFNLTCVKPDGTLNWNLSGTTSGYGNLHPVALTHEGNVLTFSSEKGVLYCFKGDGAGLAQNGWPKLYGSYGNTCSN